MRIFISHSSEERWVVQQISARLQQHGAGTFCYENDMQTGAAIGDTIWDAINGSDDVIVLLTPAAINSRWVAMEIGAALALKRNLRIFRIYLTPEQVPLEFSGGHVTSHLNEIDKYLLEVARVIGGGEFVGEKVNVVKTLEVKDASADELRASDIGKYEYPERNVDELAERLRVAFEAVTASLKPRKPTDGHEP